MLFYKLFSRFEVMGATKKLNLNITASRQNIKNLIGNFASM